MQSTIRFFNINNAALARGMWLAIVFVVAAWMTGAADAQLDVVVTRRKDSPQTIKRKGTILDWRGGSLTLNSNGIEREIEDDKIVDVQTQWSADYQSGVAELAAGKTQIAILSFQAALQAESRPWAQRIIRAKLVDAQQSIEQHGAAVQQFQQIILADPQTRFLYLAPLPWTGSGTALSQSASQWLEAREPIMQLIGASWLVGGNGREQGIKKLEELSQDIDPRIKYLAIAQLWRTRVRVNAKQIKVWQDLVNRMPRELRAGPSLVVAEAQARAGLWEKAVVNMMRIPILYPKQKSLSAAALYRAGGLLHNKGQTEQAQSLLNELISKHPQTIWANQAAQ